MGAWTITDIAAGPHPCTGTAAILSIAAALHLVVIVAAAGGVFPGPGTAGGRTRSAPVTPAASTGRPTSGRSSGRGRSWLAAITGTAATPAIAAVIGLLIAVAAGGVSPQVLALVSTAIGLLAVARVSGIDG